jgi:hypothetical protein
MTVQFAPCLNLCTLHRFFTTTRPMLCLSNWGHRLSSLVRSPPFSKMSTPCDSPSRCRNFQFRSQVSIGVRCHSQPSSCRGGWRPSTARQQQIAFRSDLVLTPFAHLAGFSLRFCARIRVPDYLDMVGVTGSIPAVPTILFNDLAKIVAPLIFLCPSFAQKIPFALRSGGRASDVRTYRG